MILSSLRERLAALSNVFVSISTSADSLFAVIIVNLLLAVLLMQASSQKPS